MITILLTFTIWFIGAFIVSFIWELFGGVLKWLILGAVMVGLYILFSTIGLPLGVAVILGIAFLIIRMAWRIVRGILNGFQTFLT